jgi:Fe-S cluster biogenesis protein NfuA
LNPVGAAFHAPTLEHAMREQIEKALDTVRPILQADGGYVELVDVLPSGIVQVRMSGACKGCPMAQMTLKSSIERAVKKMVPGVKAVEAV